MPGGGVDPYDKWVRGREFLADLDSGRSGTLVYLKAAHRVGQEIGTELASFQNLGRLGPVLEITLLRCSITWVSPLARTRVRDSAGLKGIQIDPLLGGFSMIGHGVGG